MGPPSILVGDWNFDNDESNVSNEWNRLTSKFALADCVDLQGGALNQCAWHNV